MITERKKPIPAPPVWLEEYAAIREAMTGPYDVGTHSPHHNSGPKPRVIMDDPLNPLIDGVRYKCLVKTMAAAMVQMHQARVTITDFSLQERGFSRMQLSYVQMDAAAHAMPFFDMPNSNSSVDTPNGQRSMRAGNLLSVTSGAPSYNAKPTRNPFDET